MSFLTDLFHGNFDNLGTDLSHAPSSFVHDLPSEAPYLAGAALVAAPFLAPEILPALGAGDLLAGGAEAGGAAAATDLGASSAAAGLDAASSTFGAFDPALFAANTAGAEILPTGIDLGTGAAGDLLAADPAIAATDLSGSAGALADPAAAALADPAAIAADPAAEVAATDLAPISGDAAAFAPELAGDASDPFGLLSDVGGGSADSTVPSDLMSLQAPGDAGAGSSGSFASQLASGSFDQAPASSGSFQDQLAAGSFDQAPGGGTTQAAAGILDKGGALDNALSSPLTKLGLAAAPIGLALAMGQPSLTPQGAQAGANANNLAAFGNQQLAQGNAGVLNSSQMAYLANMQNNLTNQALQNMYNMGVTDPTKDSRWPQVQANIQLQISAQTQAFIQQEIQNGLSALGASSQTLTALSQQQMASDSQFTQTLVGAVSAGARVLASTGTRTTTTTTTG